MKKLIINDNSDYFIKITQPKIQRLKEQDPFDNYEYKTISYYNKKVWHAMNIQVSQDKESQRVARSRAFSLAKQKIFFNPDMNKLVTFTYKENMQDYEKLKTDMRIFFNRQKSNNKCNPNKPQPKYLWTVEKQKRGALHIHMIANDFIHTKINKNGHLSTPMWPHGFSSILDINQTDANFKPYLYLFKYMLKSEKIGGRYIHSSRNLKNFIVLTDFNFNHKTKDRLLIERSTMGSLDRHIIRKYYKDTK